MESWFRWPSCGAGYRQLGGGPHTPNGVLFIFLKDTLWKGPCILPTHLQIDGCDLIQCVGVANAQEGNGQGPVSLVLQSHCIALPRSPVGQWPGWSSSDSRVFLVCPYSSSQGQRYWHCRI